MDCRITYNGKKYTDEEFAIYLRDNGITADQLTRERELIDKAAALASDIKGVYSEVFKIDTREALKTIAEQANSSAAEKRGAIRTVGKPMVEIAQELFPTAKPGDTYLQSGTEPKPASPKTIAKIKEFNDRIGVKTDLVNAIVVGGKKLGANGVALPYKGLIQIVNGKEEVALPEESMHIAVEIVQQKNPTLFKRLMTNVNKHPELQQVMTEYGNNKLYQTPDGKPDVIKLKKEAVAKVLARVVTQTVDNQTNALVTQETVKMWNDMANWLKGLFGEAAMDPFEETAKKVVSGEDIGNVEDITEDTGVYAQLKSDELVDKIDKVHEDVWRSQTGEWKANGQPVASSVDSTVADYLAKKTGGSSEDLAKFRKESEGNIQMEMYGIAQKYIGDDGLPRREVSDTPLDSVINPYDRSFIETLDKWFAEKIDSYPVGTKFLTNRNLYSPADNRAGKANFIAITTEGKVDINQWKLVTPVKGQKDIDQKMQEAYRIEVQGLRNLLKRAYAVKDSDFNETRAIPIVAKWERNAEGTLKLQSPIKIGNVNVILEEDPLLQPIPTLSETTGNKAIDNLIRQFKAIADSLSKQAATPGQEKIRKDRLAEAYRAVRELQVKKSAATLIKSGKSIVDYEQSKVKSKEEAIHATDPLIVGKEGLRQILDDIHISQKRLQAYENLGKTIREIYGENDKDGFTDAARTLSSKAADTISDYNRMEDYTRTNLLSKITHIKDELTAEKKLGFWKSTFLGISHGNIKSQGQMWQLANDMENGFNQEYYGLVNQIHDIKKDIDKAGITNDQTRKAILEFDKDGNWTGKTIQKIDYQAFSSAMNKVVKDKDLKKAKSIIDLEKYQAEYDRQLAGMEDYAEHVGLTGTEEENTKQRHFIVQNWKNSHDINKTTSLNPANSILFRFPKDDVWESQAYNKLRQTPQLLALHSFFTDMVERASDAGMFADNHYKKYGFFPNMSKGFIEKANSENGFKNGMFNPWRDLMGIPPGEAIGEYDPLSGEQINTIRGRYVADLGKRVYNTDGSYFTDYADVSQEVLKALYLFTADVVKFELATQAAPLMDMLVNTEGRKRVLTGKKNELGDKMDAVNIENLEKMIKYRDYYLYGKILSTEDTTVKVNVGGPLQFINNITGLKIFAVPENHIVDISIIRLLQGMSRFFNMKTMGFSVLGPIANLFGGSSNAFINSGDYFNKVDLSVAFLKLSSGLIGGDEDAHKRIEMIHWINPEETDRVQREARKFTDYKAEKVFTSEHLYIGMRKSDEMVADTVALAIFANTLIEDGKVVNLIDKVRKDNNWSGRWDLPTDAERLALEKKVHDEIEDLKLNSPNLIEKVAKLDEKGHLVLPLSTEEYSKLRSTMVQYKKGILGNMSPSDLALYRTHVFGAMAMMFKNWIPELLYKRIGAFEYDYGSGRYVYGRFRGLVGHISSFGLSGVSSIFQVLGGKKKKFAEQQRQAYEKQKQKAADEGEDFDIDYGTYVDIKMKAVMSGFKEVLAALSLLGMYYALKALAKDDKSDQYATQSAYKFSLRAIDKLQDEISFFYNPTSFTSLVNGNVFPAISLATDAEKIFQNAIALGYYELTGNQKMADKQHIMKYIYKDVPIAKEWVQYQAMWSKKFAQDNGITIQSQSGGH